MIISNMTMNVSSQPTFTDGDLRDMIALRAGPDRVPGKIKIVTDTSDFFRVDYGDVVVLEGRPYLIRNYEREGRFGIDEEPKFWVKRAIDLLDGSVKIKDNPDVFGRLDGNDLNIVFNNRVANLGKVYPYIPDSLNFVLLHFSAGAETFYDHTSQMLADLEEARHNIP